MNIRVRNAEYTKAFNRKLILSLLMQEPYSRADLARLTGLTRSSLSIIADELISEGIIIEAGIVNAKRGRNPVSLSLNPDTFCAVGVYLNRHSCHVGLVNLLGQCLDWHPVRFQRNEAASLMTDKVASTIDFLLSKYPTKKEQFLGIGISTPGPIDGKNRSIINPPGFESWHYVSICDELEKRTGCQTYLKNNADALALFNKRYGDVKNSDNFLLLLVDSGIGSGIFSGGRLHQGIYGMSGEIGHTSIDYKGKTCLCGNIGCLEAYASIPNILREWEDSYPSWNDVIEGARRYEEKALTILETESSYLSIGITNVINLFDLETVLLAGDILNGYELIAPRLREKVQESILTRNAHHIKILPSLTPKNFDIISAANIAFDSFLDLS